MYLVFRFGSHAHLYKKNHPVADSIPYPQGGWFETFKATFKKFGEKWHGSSAQPHSENPSGRDETIPDSEQGDTASVSTKEAEAPELTVWVASSLLVIVFCVRL